MPLDIPVLDQSDSRSRLAKIEPRQLIDALRIAFAGLSTGTSIQPPTAVTDYPNEEGDCLFYSGLQWDLDLVGVKVSPYVKARAANGLDPVTAYSLILSARTGEPVLMCESQTLTAVRTGATTALAVDYLVPPSAETLAVIGAGTIAIEHIRHLADLRTWKTVKMYSPALADSTSSRRSDFESVRDDLEARLGTEVTISPDVLSAVAEADAVVGCTSANFPVFDANSLKPGALVTSVTSDIKPAHEISPDQIHLFDVFCDYRPSAIAKSWELTEAANRGKWSTDKVVADLSELATRPVDVDFTRLRYFRNHGVAIEDLVIASLIMQV